MDVVVDAKVLFAALIKDNVTAELLVSWSNDKALKEKQNKVRVYHTHELLRA